MKRYRFIRKKISGEQPVKKPVRIKRTLNPRNLWCAFKSIMNIIVITVVFVISIGWLALILSNYYFRNQFVNVVLVDEETLNHSLWNGHILSLNEESLAQLLSTAANPHIAEYSHLKEKGDPYYDSILYIDKKYDVVVFHRNQELYDDVYDKVIGIQKNFDWKSGVPIGPNSILTPVSKIKITLSSEVKDYILFSSKQHTQPLLPPLDPIFKPLLSFSDPKSFEPTRTWFLAESIEFMYTRNSYTPSDISAIAKGIITGIDLIYKAGYGTRDFWDLDIFVKTSSPTTKSDNSNPILGSLVFDNGNFIEYPFLNDDIKENYVLNFKMFLMDIITKLSVYIDPVTGIEIIGVRNDDDTLVVNSHIPDEMIDFCLIICNIVENEATSISELLEHPFITGKSMERLDRYGRRPRRQMKKHLE